MFFWNTLAFFYDPVANIVLDTEFMWRDRTLSLPTRAHKGADAIWHGPCHGVVNRQGGASIEEGQLNHFWEGAQCVFSRRTCLKGPEECDIICRVLKWGRSCLLGSGEAFRMSQRQGRARGAWRSTGGSEISADELTTCFVVGRSPHLHWSVLLHSSV